MCCFSQAVKMVAGTRIFARAAEDRQWLAYQMTYAADRELAMVLPLPVPRGTPEEAVEFLNLEEYPKFFADLEAGFPMLSLPTRELEAASAPLLVHEVGRYEASYVPTMTDFARLDPRFRIEPEVWARVDGYADHGFAVFKLKDTRDPREVHPMALSFPRRDMHRVFFPTVHIHDGELHEAAQFDHRLYCQLNGVPGGIGRPWNLSMETAAEFMNTSATLGVIDANAPVWRMELFGELENRDTRVEDGPATAANEIRFGIETIDLNAVEILPEALACVPGETARGFRILPVYFQEGCLTVATAEPDNLDAMDELMNLLSESVEAIEFRVARANQIDALLDQHYPAR